MRLGNYRKEPVLFALVLFFFCLTAGALGGRLYVITMGAKAKAAVLAEIRSAVMGRIPYGKLIRYCLLRNALVAFSRVFFLLCIIGKWDYIFRLGKWGRFVGVVF